MNTEIVSTVTIDVTLSTLISQKECELIQKIIARFGLNKETAGILYSLTSLNPTNEYPEQDETHPIQDAFGGIKEQEKKPRKKAEKKEVAVKEQCKARTSKMEQCTGKCADGNHLCTRHQTEASTNEGHPKYGTIDDPLPEKKVKKTTKKEEAVVVAEAVIPEFVDDVKEDEVVVPFPATEEEPVVVEEPKPIAPPAKAEKKVKEVDPTTLCTALVKGLTQCTAKHAKDSAFCAKHAEKREYGVVGNPIEPVKKEKKVKPEKKKEEVKAPVEPVPVVNAEEEQEVDAEEITGEDGNTYYKVGENEVYNAEGEKVGTFNTETQKIEFA